MSIAVIPEQDIETRWREAKALASADLVPAAFKGNPANVLLVMALAKHIGAEPFMVMQNADVIHGKVALRATYLIGCVNASKRFTALRFKYDGAGQTRSCYAYATEHATGERVEGPTVDVAMANAEGWSAKAGSKWKTMPDLMLAYRAGAFFSRLYASDITLGMHTTDEVEDMGGTPSHWQDDRQPIQAVVVDPTRDEFETLLAASGWSDKQRASLRTRYGKADADGRAALVVEMAAHVAPVALSAEVADAG